MTDRSNGGRIAAQRFKESAFNKPIKAAPRDNARANQKALKDMSLVELQTGRSPEWWDSWHRENRARVRARWLGETA